MKHSGRKLSKWKLLVSRVVSKGNFQRVMPRRGRKEAGGNSGKTKRHNPLESWERKFACISGKMAQLDTANWKLAPGVLEMNVVPASSGNWHARQALAGNQGVYLPLAGYAGNSVEPTS